MGVGFLKGNLFKRNFLFLFCASLLILLPAKHAQAQCGFNTIGDYTCAQPLGGGGGGGGGTSTTGGFNGADLLVNDILPNMIDPSCPAIGSLSTTLSSLPPQITTAMTGNIMSTLSGGDCAAIGEILSSLTGLQTQFAGIAGTDPCSGGGGGGGGGLFNFTFGGNTDPNNTGNDVMGQAFTSFLFNQLSLDLSFSIGPLNVNLGSIFGDAVTNACDALSCAQPGGGSASPGAGCTPVDNSTIDQDIIDLLLLREGSVPCAYPDTNGHLTIGVGHLIIGSDPPLYSSPACRCNGSGPYNSGSTPQCIPQSEIESLLQHDMGWAKEAAVNQMAQMGINCQEFLPVLVSTNYQLGAGWRSRLPSGVWANMQAGNFADAANALPSSHWWWTQTPTRAQDFENALMALDSGGTTPAGGSCPAGVPGASGGEEFRGDSSQPGADALGKWCPDAGAAGYATDSALPGTYNITETDPGRMIAESAMMSVGATTGDDDNVTSSSGRRGGLGCALAVTRILRCAGINQPYEAATRGFQNQFIADTTCYEEVGTTGPIDFSLLAPGDIINTATGGGGHGHIGIFIGGDSTSDMTIVSNSSSGFSGSNGEQVGGVKQNYSVDSWNSNVVTRGGTETRVWRRICPI